MDLYYSEETIEEVRSASDIVDVVSSYVKIQKRGAQYMGLCPFHNEKTPSFSVSPSKQMYYCFGCGAGGNVITFIMQYENLTFIEALKFLAERSNIALPQKEETQGERKTRSEKNILLEINKLAAMYFIINSDNHRGIRPETICWPEDCLQRTLFTLVWDFQIKLRMTCIAI